MSQHNVWEIELNAKTGIIESWKVVYTIEFIEVDSILFLIHLKDRFSFNVICLLNEGNGHRNVLM